MQKRGDVVPFLDANLSGLEFSPRRIDHFVCLRFLMIGPKCHLNQPNLVFPSFCFKNGLIATYSSPLNMPILICQFIESLVVYKMKK